MPTPVEFFCCDQDVVKVGQKAKSVKSIVYPPITGGFEAGGAMKQCDVRASLLARFIICYLYYYCRPTDDR